MVDFVLFNEEFPCYLAWWFCKQETDKFEK